MAKRPPHFIDPDAPKLIAAPHATIQDRISKAMIRTMGEMNDPNLKLFDINVGGSGEGNPVDTKIIMERPPTNQQAMVILLTMAALDIGRSKLVIEPKQPKEPKARKNRHKASLGSRKPTGTGS